MTRHLERIAGAALSLVLVLGLVFLVLEQFGSAALEDASGISLPPQARAVLQARYGLDRTSGERLRDGLGRLLRLDFGRSLYSGRPVEEHLVPAVAASLPIWGLSLLSALALALAWTALDARLRCVGKRWAQDLGRGWAVAAAVPWAVWGVALYAVSGRGTAVALTLALALPLAGYFCRGLSAEAENSQLFQSVMLMSSLGVGWPGALLHGLLLPLLRRTVSWLAAVAPGVAVAAPILERLYERPGLGTLISDALARRDAPVFLAVVVLLVGFTRLLRLGAELLDERPSAPAEALP